MEDVLVADGCPAVKQTDVQTDGHPTVTIRQCDVGRTSSGRLHNSGTDRQTD